MDYGIKVVKAGANIDTVDIRDILMSSKYSMLKYHSNLTDSVTFNPGDSEKYVDFNHNLGYVPAYMAYYYRDSKLYYMYIPRAVGYSGYGYSFADSSKIRCGYFMPAWNQYYKVASGSTNYWCGHDTLNNHLIVGKKSGKNDPSYIRFTGGDIFGQNYFPPQGATITYANLQLAMEYKGAGTPVKGKYYGIKELNTAVFSGDPGGRPKTTAMYTQDTNMPNGGFAELDMKDEVQEIVNQGGWHTDHAMGFALLDNGSNDGAYFEDNQSSGDNSKFTIRWAGTTTITFRVIIFKDKIA